MNRLRAAEIELNEMIKTSNELITVLNLLRLRQIATMVYIKVTWVKAARNKLKQI
jgi:ribosomal protein L30/L7E